jgi:hypothetical protein
MLPGCMLQFAIDGVTTAAFETPRAAWLTPL